MWTPYAQSTGSITDALNRLRSHIADVPARLGTLSEAELTQHAPGKWSKKEILGHLIDSGINNLKRFTDAQFSAEPYRLQPYDQNSLVLVNQYQRLPVTHLLDLWCHINTQISYVAEAIPTDKLNTVIRFADPDAANKTLGWLIDDYVAHLEHHLKTLL